MKTNSTIYRGKRLRELRESKDLSLRELTERVNTILSEPISHSSIKRYEEGSACDIDVLIAICNVLDYDMITLLQECISYDKKLKKSQNKK